MGTEQSKLSVLRVPWREIKWGDNKDDLKYVMDFKPPAECQQIRIFLHGPVGAGKSSFINSVQSILYGRMYTLALADNTQGDSFTRMYRTYKIRKGDEDSVSPFVFSDIMGLEARNGILVDDVKLAFKGHVKDNYKFSTDTKLSEDNQFYNKSPTPNDKVHVLVCVVPVDTISSIKDETVWKIREIRKEASELNIPQVVLLTKIDQAFPEVGSDLRKIYKIKYLKEKMEQFSADMGVPLNCIFPVRNYSSETDLNGDTDTLILSAMRRILQFAGDYTLFQKDQSES